VLEGGAVTLSSLSDAISSYPVMAEKKLVVLRDFDIQKPPSAMQDGLLTLLTDLPDYLVLIVSYDTIPYTEGKKSPLNDLIREKAIVVNFQKSSEAELVRWVQRRFSALGKTILREECGVSHLRFPVL
jgi:DNA polymerase-3 subunit delta